MQPPERSQPIEQAALDSYAQPKKIWQNLEDEVLSELELLIRQGLYARVPENDELTDILAREEAFVAAIVQKLHRALSHGFEQALILFDIDKTCVTAVTQPRPSLKPLLAKMQTDLGRDKLHAGILSNRDQENLERLIQPGHILEGLRALIHPRHVHSAVPVSYRIARWLGEVEGYPVQKQPKEDILRYLDTDQPWAGLIDWDRFLAEDDQHLYDYLTVGKLKTLAPIRDSLPAQTALIVVDDLPFTALLRAEKGMYGVHIDEPKQPLAIPAHETSRVYNARMTRDRINFLLENLDAIFPSDAQQQE